MKPARQRFDSVRALMRERTGGFSPAAPVPELASRVRALLEPGA